MAKSKTESKESVKEEVKLPPLGFGKKGSIFSGSKFGNQPKFIPKTFRITQHKGG